MKMITVRELLKAGAVGLVLALAAGPTGGRAQTTDTQQTDCHVTVNTDNGKGGTQVRQCGDSLTVGVSGPVSTSLRKPLGGDNGAFQVTGRAVEQAGRNLRDAARFLGGGGSSSCSNPTECKAAFEVQTAMLRDARMARMR